MRVVLSMQELPVGLKKIWGIKDRDILLIDANLHIVSALLL